MGFEEEHFTTTRGQHLRKPRTPRNLSSTAGPGPGTAAGLSFIHRRKGAFTSTRPKMCMVSSPRRVGLSLPSTYKQRELGVLHSPRSRDVYF